MPAVETSYAQYAPDYTYYAILWLLHAAENL